MAICFLAGFLLAIFIVFMLNLRAVAAARRRRKKELAEHPEKKVQATKIIVFSIMATYYIAFAVGVWVVIVKDVYQLSVLLTFVGSVAVFAVAFYCWKSKAENLEKIRKNNPDLMGSLSDFSNMGSQ
ncbi:MAG: hypothetical protein BACD_02325 [Bacteroides rodentium]